MTKLLNEEPTTFEEVAEKKQWKEAMTEEHQSIIKNDVWEIVPRPKEKSVVTSKWVYKIKHATYGSVDKYKARFIARGFSQKEGEDYDKTFALLSNILLLDPLCLLMLPWDGVYIGWM
jgi:hypothetical protein